MTSSNSPSSLILIIEDDQSIRQLLEFMFQREGYETTTAADAREALKQSGAAGVMVGRAAQGKPWLPAAIERALMAGGEIASPSRERLLVSLLELYEDTLAFYDVRLGVRIARKHIAWMIDAAFGEPARETRKQICTFEDPKQVREALIALFEPAPLQDAA